MTSWTPPMSRPRAATSVATRTEPVLFVRENFSMERMRAFWIIWECRECAGMLRVWSMGVRRRTEWMELVKMRVR